MNPFFVTTAGWVRDEPSVTTTSGQLVMVFRLAVGMPPNISGPDCTAECCKVVASGALASRLDGHLHKGEHVFVRARSLTTESWVTDDGVPHSVAVVLADTIAASLMSGPASAGNEEPEGATVAQG